MGIVRMVWQPICAREQEMLTLPENEISHLALPGVRDIRFTIDLTTVRV